MALADLARPHTVTAIHLTRARIPYAHPSQDTAGESTSFRICLTTDRRRRNRPETLRHMNGVSLRRTTRRSKGSGE